MKYRLLTTIFALFWLSVSAGQQANLAGEWHGALSAGGQSLRLIFRISEADGVYSSTIESVDQGGQIIPTEETSLEGEALVISVASVGGEYQATLSGDTISGNWTQLGNSLELVLQRQQ